MAMQTIKVVCNSGKSVPVEVKKAGKTYLVADAVIINEGVLEGSAGPILYLTEDMGKNPEDWDNCPIVLNHPVDSEGIPVTANSKEVIEEQGLGFLANTRVEDKLLKTKLWFDVPLLKRVGKNLYNSIKKGERVELSTGLIADEEEKSGEYEGVPYRAIARNYQPDHLAVLLDQQGACSTKRGCGVNVNSFSGGENGVEEGVFRKFLNALMKGVGLDREGDKEVIGNEVSHDQLRMNLSDTLRSYRTQDQPYCHIYEVYDDYFIFEEMGDLWRQDYKINSDDSPELKGKPKQVRREISYVTNSDSDSDSEVQTLGEDMKLTKEQRQQKIKYITANCSCWKRQGDDAILNTLNDEKLLDIEKDAQKEVKTQEIQQAAKAGFTADQVTELGNLIQQGIKTVLQTQDGKMPWERNAETTTTEVARAAETVTANEYLASAPPEIRSALATSMRINQQHKDGLINRIIGNEQDQAKRTAHHARLNLKTVEQLEEIVSYIPVVNQSPLSYQVPNYLGAGVLVNSNSRDEEVEDQEDTLVMPKIEY